VVKIMNMPDLSGGIWQDAGQGPPVLNKDGEWEFRTWSQPDPRFVEKEDEKKEEKHDEL
jgi:hypothetical protein